MRLLLDTHVWVWAATSPERCRPEVQELLATSPDVVVSSVVAMEVAIKQALGKLDPSPALLDPPGDHAFSTMPVTWAHAVELGALPRYHGDPFDRLLVAQARVEGCSIVTADPLLSRYDVTTVPA